MCRYLLFIGALFWPGSALAESDKAAAPDIARAIEFMKAGDFQQAIKELDSIPEAQRTTRLYLHRALCWSNIGDDVQARADVAKAKSMLNPNRWDYDLVRPQNDVISVEVVWTDIERPMRERPIATALFIGDYAGVVERADAALRETPGDAELLVLCGEAYGHQGQYALARADFDEAVRCDPLNPDRYLARVSVLMFETYPLDPIAGEKWPRICEAALTDIAAANSLKPSLLAYDLSTYINLQEFAFALAEEDYTQLLERSNTTGTSRAGLFVGRAILRKHLGDEASAASDFAQAIRHDPRIGAYRYYARAQQPLTNNEVRTFVLIFAGFATADLLAEDLQEKRLAHKK
jgi:tetratricopeptide (TPR) repeat protein